jgi:hypothetical protein
LQSGAHVDAQKGSKQVKLSHYYEQDLLGGPVIGAPVATQEVKRLEGQQQRVEALMADGYWHTVPELQKELKRRFGQLYSETSISARLRAMRKRGFTVTHERTRAGSNLYQYRAFKPQVAPVIDWNIKDTTIEVAL